VNEVDRAELLATGRAFADLSGWRKVGVDGREALSWLQGLLTADLSDLAPGRARRSLLLSPTGQVRAEVTVAVPGGSILLLQDPLQPSVADLLAPYVLSSDVRLDDRTDELTVLSFPGLSTEPSVPGTAASSPSCLGRGVDLVAMAEDREGLVASLSRSFTPATAEDVEVWRVRAGIPRVGVDTAPEDLPQEAGLEEAVAFDKGCYLGQEAVARVRNLGHPRRVVLALEADRPVERGEPVLVEGAEVGRVTSSAPGPGGRGAVLLARVRWEARGGPFRTRSGTMLRPRPPSYASTPV
jgi:folate-binding protein YgfZ